MSRTWTICTGTGPGHGLVGCRILVTPGAGNSTYQFQPGGGVEGASGSGSTPSFFNLYLNGKMMNVIAGGDPPVSGYWSGSCNTVGQREAENGTWQAEATGGGPVDDDDDSEESEEDKSDEDDAQ